MRIEGLRSLTNKLNGRVRAARDISYVVGFTQKYAVHVHEHKAGHKVGQWKYLEQPARELGKELGNIVKVAVKGGATMAQGFILAGLRLLREAQDKFVPVDTSALKASGFVAEEHEVAQKAMAAYAKSEAVRIAALAKRRAK